MSNTKGPKKRTRRKDIMIGFFDANTSQQEIADSLGVTRQAVNRVVCGNAASARIEEAIARRINKPRGYLFPREKMP